MRWTVVVQIITQVVKREIFIRLAGSEKMPRQRGHWGADRTDVVLRDGALALAKVEQ